MYPTRSLQLNIRTHKVTAKSSGGKMANKQHSEKRGKVRNQNLGFRSTDYYGPRSLSTCDDQGNRRGPLGLFDVPCTQCIPHTDAGSHAEACWDLRRTGNSQWNRVTANPRGCPTLEVSPTHSPGYKIEHICHIFLFCLVFVGGHTQRCYKGYSCI